MDAGENWAEGISCGMCLTEDSALLYFPDPFNEEIWFCQACWERCERQQAMIDADLEQNPEIEN